MGIFDFLFNRPKEVHRDTLPEDNFTWLWKDYERTEQYFLNQEQKHKDDAYKLHFTYNSLIELYNRYKEIKPDALDKLISVCNDDIRLLPAFKDSWLKQHNTMPNIPSFKRLAILYEKQKRYYKAIDICKKAIEYGLHDGTKNGYEGRLKRLQNKMS